MAIANEKIIQKMINELHQAKESEHSHDKMVRHISNVKLLCDLFLEGDQVPTIKRSEDISSEELKAMLGESVAASPASPIKQSNIKRTYQPDEDDANGSSIFDF